MPGSVEPSAVSLITTVELCVAQSYTIYLWLVAMTESGLTNTKSVPKWQQWLACGTSKTTSEGLRAGNVQWLGCVTMAQG